MRNVNRPKNFSIKMPLLWAMVLSYFFLIGCGQGDQDFNESPVNPDRLQSKRKEEREQIAPTDLMAAVYNNNISRVRELTVQDPAQLRAKNAEQDTALGLALKNNFVEIASYLLSQMGRDELFHVNAKKQSYVFLAAQQGQANFIRELAAKYFKAMGWHERYQFVTLDQPDEHGRRALFIALDRRTAMALEEEYFRGFVKIPFWSFILNVDHHNQTFLHRAAEDGRDDVIRWAAEKICYPNSWESSDSVWLSLPSQIINQALRTVQTYIGDLNSPIDLIFNRRDDNFRTPLHLALQVRQWKSVRALTSCRWLDYDLADTEGRLPVHSFLAYTNPFLNPVSQAEREIFAFLFNQNTSLRMFYRTPRERANQLDKNGFSALHVAARMADPFFYTLLSQHGDINLRSREGSTPLEIRKATQARLGQYDR